MSSSDYPTKNDDSLACFNGGGDKPITDKQKDYIFNLARIKKANLNDLVGDNYYNTIQDFNGEQANLLIRTLRNLPKPKKNLYTNLKLNQFTMD